MNRRFLFRLPTIVLLGLTLLPGNVVAQQTELKHQLQAACTLVSAECIKRSLDVPYALASIRFCTTCDSHDGLQLGGRA